MVYVAGLSVDSDEIRRKVLRFICLRGPVITDGLRSYSVAFRDYHHIAVKHDDYELLKRFNANCSEAYNLSFRIFMAPRHGVSKVYLDLYAAGATFYANFYSAEPCLALTALCYMLVGEVL